MAKRGRRTAQAAALQGAEAYRHPEAESLLRPDVGTQSQFKKKKSPVTYHYDSSLSPALDWDGQNPARELSEWLIGLIEKAAALPPPHVFDKPQEFKHGVPCLKGTRVPVSVLVDNIADGDSVDDLLAAYPQLTAEDIHAALKLAAEVVNSADLIPLAKQGK